MDALFLGWLGGIEGFFRTLRVSRANAAGTGKFLIIVWPIPIAAPLPDVARHVVEAVAIRWKRFHGRDTGKFIFASILNRELALVGFAMNSPPGLNSSPQG